MANEDDLASGDSIVFLNSYGVPEPLRLIKGTYRDITPPEWKSDPPPDPVYGTITVEDGSATVKVSPNSPTYPNAPWWLLRMFTRSPILQGEDKLPESDRDEP